MQVTFIPKDNFFDRPAIQAAVAAAGQDPDRLKRAGLLIRSEARRSMRFTKKKSAPPGQPPRAHKPDPGNLRQISAFWDPTLRAARIGANVFPGHTNQLMTVPQVHEFGGRIRQRMRVRLHRGPRGASGRKPTRRQLAALKRKSKSPEAQLLRKIAASRQPVKYVDRFYPARPYMWPALLRSLHKLPRLWRASIRNIRVRPAVRQGVRFGGASVGAA